MRRLAAVLGTLGILAACDTIVARPLTGAPLNACPAHPCDQYDADAGPAAASCSPAGQCLIVAAGNRPAVAFWIVVNLPDTSIFAPGLSYVFFGNAAAGAPAFTAPAIPNPRCNAGAPERCLPIGGAASFSGTYVADRSATDTIKSGNTLDAPTLAPIVDLDVDQAIPVRVMFTPVGNTQQAELPSLPLQPLVVTSGTTFGAPLASPNGYSRVLLAGTYTRELYPEPPFDAIYPPTTQQITFTPALTVQDDLHLFVPQPTQPAPTAGQALDFSTNQCSVSGTLQDSRCAIVTRDDGLDGWRVWIENATTRNRISVVRTFSNTVVDGKVSVVTQAPALLYTAIGPVIGDGYNAVVAPPAAFLGVPRLETPLFGGTQGLQTLVVPTFPPPVTVQGVVAEPGDGSALLGYAAKVELASTTLTTTTGTSPLLHYETTVSTDERGRFATVVPPGSYTATIEPAVGTGFAKTTTTVVVDLLTVSALTLQPPKRPVLRGRAVLSDGRALGEATVIAEPWTAEDGTVGRPGRATTLEDGSYAIELDPGPYILTVLPKDGTGFPNVVRAITVKNESTTVPDFLIPPPTRMSFTLRDPNVTANPIVRAVVRIFASLPGFPAPVEIGTSMTDTNGLVEILLAPQPQ